MSNVNPFNAAQLAKKNLGQNEHNSAQSKLATEPAADTHLVTLEAWVDSVYAKDAKAAAKTSDHKSDEDYRPTVMLSRFGLKTPNDVKLFLRSPAGEALITEIQAELAKEKAIENKQQFDQQEKRLLMSRLKALMFLWYLEKKAHAADKIKDLVLQQNEKAIERAQSTGAPKQQTAVVHSIQQIDNAISDYAKVLNTLDTKGSDLDKQMERLNLEEAHLTVKYSTYEDNILAFENFLGSHHSLSDIEKRILELKQQMDAYVDEVNELLQTGKDDEARILLHVLTGLNAQAAGYHDMIDVLRNKKFFVNADGEAVTSVKDAELTLNISQKIVKDADGMLYLIKSSDDWDQIKADPHAKANARKGYEALKQDPQAMSVKKVVQHNKVLELNLHSIKVQETIALKQENQYLKMMITNEVTQLTALRGTLLNQDNQSNQSINTEVKLSLSPMPTPSPKPKSASVAPAKKTAQANPVDLFKKRLDELKQATQLTRDDLFNLANQAPGANKIAAMAYLQSMFVNMPRTGNIPFQTMQSMLRNMERFGVDATKEAVTAIKSEPELRQQAENKTTAEPTRPAPTPFKTKPFG
ncbi:hypothetical protein [Legionella worsleiensis]|uniref:Dot/Icm system substrate protein LidA n=1 Tax=Legionella worsleiensis TaxID=45076 RepID=A0A0W1A949_9GAMM|nr:hypothetical protein [Legionella worsleiensis]KTD77849.1 Dot/Icm system substrate protein LidA [Legionella worsleiensis]STY33091.1 Dot/Icm system substrate protein LidA [Legionella worsleiensis]